jgi:hypothetical protein
MHLEFVPLEHVCKPIHQVLKTLTVDRQSLKDTIFTSASRQYCHSLQEAGPIGSTVWCPKEHNGMGRGEDRTETGLILSIGR